MRCTNAAIWPYPCRRGRLFGKINRMYVERVARVLGAALAVLTVACTSTPTSPSRAAQAPTVANISQEPPPVPPRLNVNPPAAVGATRFLAFGDSITFGYGASSDGAFVYDHSGHSYPVRLRLALNQYHAPQVFTVISDGVPGEWALDGARRIQASITTHRPQALLLLEGINDLGSGQSPAQAANSVNRIVNTALLNNVPVLVANMYQTVEVRLPTGELRDNAAALVPEFNTELRRLMIGRQNVFFVDLNRAFGSDRSLISGDGLHPSEAGYELMATTFHAAIELAFPVRGSFQ